MPVPEQWIDYQTWRLCSVVGFLPGPMPKDYGGNCLEPSGIIKHGREAIDCIPRMDWDMLK